MAEDKLKDFIDLKYNSVYDARAALGMAPAQIRQSYFELQHELYNGSAINAVSVHGDLHVNGNTAVGTLNNY